MRAHVRRAACRALGHEDPAAFGLTACPIADEDLLDDLYAAVHAARRAVPGSWARWPVLPAAAGLTDDDSALYFLEQLEAARNAQPTTEEPCRA